MHADRRFRLIALGVAPLVLLGLVFVQLLGVPRWLGSPAWIAALAVEAVVLWRVADPAIAATGARTRRVAFGLLQSVVTACVVGGVLLAVGLMLVLGPDG
ncbi:hypothetical protein DSM112329_05270 [Paraconexibacter sp. AEG42_29]|uniref:Uncharacterized protein n=1 Tax=Paraconexibacter sp. AEG42_29 TaxID=2997339 RepID=A0AAU7B3C0_9ACTN